jgi:CheY-like chemotaxis protein
MGWANTVKHLQDLRILVVEDDAMVRRIIVRALTNVCPGVRSAESGEHALNALAQQPFDVIISDLKMPGINGLDVLEQARKLQPQLALVITTGFADTADEEAIRRLNATLLPKPFGNAQLLEAIRRTLPTDGSA